MKPQEEIISQLKDRYGIKEDSTIAVSIRIAFEKLQEDLEKELKGRETLRDMYADKLAKNIELKERIEEAHNLLNKYYY